MPLTVRLSWKLRLAVIQPIRVRPLASGRSMGAIQLRSINCAVADSPRFLAQALAQHDADQAGMGRPEPRIPRKTP